MKAQGKSRPGRAGRQPLHEYLPPWLSSMV